MRFPSLLLAVAAGAFFAGAAPADTLSIDRSGSGMSDRQPLPDRGMSMRQVEASYGAPVKRVAPVGQPPISRWEYPDYVVYFEYSHVVHAVMKRPGEA